MKKKTCRKNRINGGFSLVEMLIVVAIMVVLLAVGIPSLFGLVRNLKMTELDGFAREIYVEVQNRLVSMKASGELSNFRQELAASYADRNLGNLGETYCPVDYAKWRRQLGGPLLCGCG